MIREHDIYDADSVFQYLYTFHSVVTSMYLQFFISSLVFHMNSLAYSVVIMYG